MSIGIGSTTLTAVIINSVTELGAPPAAGSTESIICISYTVTGTTDAGGLPLTLTFEYLTPTDSTPSAMTSITPGTSSVFMVTTVTPTEIASGNTSASGVFYWQVGGDLGFVGTNYTVIVTATDGVGATQTVSFSPSAMYLAGNSAVPIGGFGGDDLTPGVGGSTGRARHTAHLLTSSTVDGRVIVAGGIDSNLMTLSVDRFDIDVGQRNYVPTAVGGAMRVNHASSFFFGAGNTTRVLVTGGRSANAGPPGNSTTVYAFSPGESAAAGPNMGVARARHAACWLPDNRVLITGGEGIAGEMLADPTTPFTMFATAQTAEIFDPATNSIVAATHMPFARADHSCCLLPDGTVLVAGGRDPGNPNAPLNACIYNPRTDTWTVLADIIDRYQHTATLLVNGVCYLVGGRQVSDNSILSSALAYRPFMQASTSGTHPAGFSLIVDPMVAGRTEHATTLLGDGSLLVVGGFSPSAATKIAMSTAEVFIPFGFTAPLLGAFSPASALADARARHTLTTLNSGSAVVLGGVADEFDSTFVDTIEAYQFNNTAPATTAPNVGSTASPSAVSISFTLSDTEGDRAFVFVRFSTDGGLTFRLASLNDFSATVNLAPGARTVSWNAAMDGISSGAGTVVVQIIPVAGSVGSPQASTAQF